MAKKVTGMIKLQLPGKSNSSTTSRSSPCQHGVNIMGFCRNLMQKQLITGLIIPVVTRHQDRSFSFILKTPPAAVLLKKAAGIESGLQHLIS